MPSKLIPGNLSTNLGKAAQALMTVENMGRGGSGDQLVPQPAIPSVKQEGHENRQRSDDQNNELGNRVFRPSRYPVRSKVRINDESESEDEEGVFRGRDHAYFPKPRNPPQSRRGTVELTRGADTMNEQVKEQIKDDHAPPQIVETPARSQGNECLTIPSDHRELKHIINAIDQRHCFKYRWFVARHLRRNHDPALILSRQLYYKRVIKNHDFVRPNQRGGGPKGWVLARIRPVPFSRLDYDATRAHLEIRESFNTSDWSSEKKRIPPERLLIILREAPKEYGWEEIITDATVETVLIESGVFDLTAFELSQPATRPALPSPDGDTRIPNLRYEDEDEVKRDRMAMEEVQAEFQEEAQLRSPEVQVEPRPLRTRGRVDPPQPQQQQRDQSQVVELRTTHDQPHHSVSPQLPPQTLPPRGAKEINVKKKKKEKKMKKESNKKESKKQRHARKREHRRRRSLEAQLEGLQQQFQEELADVSCQYHRRRLRVEKKLRLIGSV